MLWQYCCIHVCNRTTTRNFFFIFIINHLCLFFPLSVENVPAELRDPFYCDQYEQEHLKPPVTHLLQSSELYCRTYNILLGSTATEAQPKDNATLLQLLTQRGVVAKDQDTTVTDADLRHKPIKMVKWWNCLGDGEGEMLLSIILGILLVRPDSLLCRTL